MRILLILLATFIPFIAHAKERKGGDPISDYNSETFWKKIKLEKHLPARAITAADTTLFVVSNRKTAYDDPLRYMSEERDGKELHYFFVYTGDGVWHAVQVESLEKAIQYEPKKNDDWVVYTEGMGKLFTTDVARGIAVAGLYKVNVILLDYPSISTTRRPFANYFFAMKNAKINYKDFAPVLERIKQLRDERKMGTGKLSLFYHSMGNHLQRDIIKHHNLGNLNDEVWVDNLILNAPCVPRRNTRKWMPKIHYAKHIYVHYNNGDFTLGGAYLASKKLQLGQKPLRHTYSKHIDYVNFNTVCGRHHTNFLPDIDGVPTGPSIIRHYTTVLHGNQVNLSDAQLYRPTAYKNVGWDVRP